VGIHYPHSPAPRGYHSPNRLNQSEGPCALQEAVSRAQKARARERNNEPMAAAFQGVAYKHRSDREKAEEREAVHVAIDPLSMVRRQAAQISN
jgi:hypothetical protein